MSEPNILDRISTAIREIIREEFPNLSYLGTWLYTADGDNGDGTINCSSDESTVPFPSLNNVPIQADSSGSVSTPTPGNACFIRFINGDPTRPIVVGNQAIVRTATIDATDTVNVGESVSDGVVLAGGSSPVARSGDSITVYFPKGDFMITGTVIASPGTFTGSINLGSQSPATGVITSGQPKVLA